MSTKIATEMLMNSAHIFPPSTPLRIFKTERQDFGVPVIPWLKKWMWNVKQKMGEVEGRKESWKVEYCLKQHLGRRPEDLGFWIYIQGGKFLGEKNRKRNAYRCKNWIGNKVFLQFPSKKFCGIALTKKSSIPYMYVWQAVYKSSKF